MDASDAQERPAVRNLVFRIWSEEAELMERDHEMAIIIITSETLKHHREKIRVLGRGG